MISRKYARKALFLMLFLFSVLMVQTGFCAAAKETEAKDVIIKAGENSAHLKNYNMKMEGSASAVVQGRNLTFTFQGDSDIQNQPLLYKNVINVTVKMDATFFGQQIIQYLQQEGKQLMVYSNINNTWIKQAVPFDPSLNAELMNTDYKLYTKSVKPVKSTDDYTVYEVVVDGKQLEEGFKKAMALAEIPPAPSFSDIFKDVGDFKYNITVDRKKTLISGIDADLTEFVGRIGNNVVEKLGMPEQQRQTAKEVLDTLKMDIHLQCSQFNSAENITIPEVALKAPLLPSPAKSVGVVDVQKIKQESNIFKEQQNRIAKKGQELFGQLEADRNNLSEEEFQQRQQEVYQEFDNWKKALEKEADASMRQAIVQVAKEKKLKSVFYKNSEKDRTPFDSMDITAEVLAKMQ
jgi:outer membrane protein